MAGVQRAPGPNNMQTVSCRKYIMQSAARCILGYEEPSILREREQQPTGSTVSKVDSGSLSPLSSVVVQNSQIDPPLVTPLIRRASYHWALIASLNNE